MVQVVLAHDSTVATAGLVGYRGRTGRSRGGQMHPHLHAVHRGHGVLCSTDRRRCGREWGCHRRDEIIGRYDSVSYCMPDRLHAGGAGGCCAQLSRGRTTAQSQRLLQWTMFLSMVFCMCRYVLLFLRRHDLVRSLNACITVPRRIRSRHLYRQPHPQHHHAVRNSTSPSVPSSATKRATCPSGSNSTSARGWSIFSCMIITHPRMLICRFSIPTLQRGW